jgi:hypothetical protein
MENRYNIGEAGERKKYDAQVLMYIKLADSSTGDLSHS